MNLIKKIGRTLLNLFCLAFVTMVALDYFTDLNTLGWLRDELDIVAPGDLTATTNTADRLPSVPEELYNHVYLDARAAGISSTLTGDVLVTVILVDDPTGSWSDEEVAAIRENHETAAADIVAEAAAYGVDLNLTFQYLQADAATQLPDDDAVDWADGILTDLGLASYAQTSLSLETEYQVDEAPVLFYISTSGRAYAMPYTSGTFSEIAFFFKTNSDASSFRHELYHLFGAKDYYYPEEVAALAQTYFSDSPMLSSENAVTDELTAYLIGWTDELSEDALKFLQETSDLTKWYLEQANENETYTGYVEDYRSGDTTYTGYLDWGIPQGEGTQIWDDGGCYTGEWDYGQFHGTGTFTWSNGDSYSGTWEHGIRHGEGTYTWANGDCYTGEWVDGERSGYGTYTWADGTTQSGYWENGEFVE